MAVNSATAGFGYGFLDSQRSSASSQQARQLEESAAAQLRASLHNAGETLTPGATVTTRTRYKIGANGEFIPLDTQITKETSLTPDDAAGKRSQGRKYFDLQNGTSGLSLSSLSQPRPQLTPSEELTVYAGSHESTALSSTAVYVSDVASGHAVDEAGEPIAVDILKPGDGSDIRTVELLALSSRAQATAASLYARNNDVVFHASPYAELAV